MTSKIEKKTDVISIINYKGGVGKSTVTFNLAGELEKRGYKTLLLDFDGQGNLTKMCGYQKEKVECIVKYLSELAGDVSGELIFDKFPIYNFSDKTDIIPCNASFEKFILDCASYPARETLLKRFLEQLKSVYDYDFILIDNAPCVNVASYNSLAASDYYLLITEADDLAVDGIETIVRAIKLVKNLFNPSLKSSGILINKYLGRTNVQKYERENIAEAFGMEDKVYDIALPEGVAAKECKYNNLPICKYKPDCKFGEAVNKFADEFLMIVR